MAVLYVDWIYWRGGSLWVHLSLLSCPTSLLAKLLVLSLLCLAWCLPQFPIKIASEAISLFLTM